jgi:hypothetical protein
MGEVHCIKLSQPLRPSHPTTAWVRQPGAMRMVNKLEQKTVNVGDLVQWASDGADQFDTPRRVRATQRHDRQEWAFVEGSKTGMPVSELTVVTSASAVMEEKAPSDPVASPLMTETWKRSAASLSVQHATRTADSSLPTGAGPGCQTRHFTAGIRIAREKHTSRTSSFTVLAFALAAIASAASIYAIVRMNRSLGSPPIMTATPPAPVITDAAAPVAPDAPAPAMERSGLAELNASEIWELQARLEFLGMRPGSLDGIPGPQTAAAIRRYEESRGRAQTGKLDRELLERLRQEPN